jgi:hypothetical protein
VVCPLTVGVAAERPGDICVAVKEAMAFSVETSGS